MVDRFQKILKENPPKEPSRLFFLSGSPQHLFTYIEKFLDYNNFPKHVTILKQVHGDNSDSLFDQMAYKTEKIEELIALYPDMQWLMFGDSGEKDKDIYTFIKEKYPSKVKGYYIRNVESGEIDFFE
jgi:phosphatidate phosphatase APP1